MMAEPIPAAAPVAPSTKDALAATRKRRRRAPTTGAADDCFACQDLSTKCDRRRPYCTQCIERGKVCAGYKTQLTWGVGVASRGKLRGLSLPVAKSKKAVDCEKMDGKRGSGGSGHPKSRTSKDTIKEEPESGTDITIQRATSSATPTHTTFGFINVDPNAPMHSPAAMTPHYDWQQQQPPPRQAQMPQSQKKGPRRLSLQPLHMPPPLATPDYGQAPLTAGVFGGYGEHAILSSPMTPMTPSFHSGPEPMPMPMPIAKVYQPQDIWHGGSYSESYGSVPSVTSWQSEASGSSLSSDRRSRNYREDDRFYPDSGLANTLDTIIGAQGFSASHDNRYSESIVKEEPFEDEHHLNTIAFQQQANVRAALALSMPSPNSIQSTLVGKTPGLRQLINYYDQVIAPVIVAFDGPTNPYRTHILRMAHESEALQHAIAALSASNLRMRRDHDTPRKTICDTPQENTHDVSVRKSSIAHNQLREALDESEARSRPGRPSQTELYHKGESIKALNNSLARGMDSSAANDDTVLATLLVLCLYHICDTGVAKFKTQFAGVKKLMALRNRKTNANEVKWLITMFKWFDAMTATVNDREGQLEDLPFSFDQLEDDEWALENLAGCDGRLFRIISKLGRLNLLSQGKMVNDGSTTPKPTPPRPATQDFYSINSTRFDGNGWGNLLPDSDTFPDETESSFAGEPRYQFHTEWASIRQELMDWRFDPTSLPPPMRTDLSYVSLDANAVDLNNISESFRYSALLYTERLAHPNQPSSSPNFQTLVSHAIHHIHAVKSDVYLLWPLFITGTECIESEHRMLVRKRCHGIQSDSGFYNNTSTLTLLEKIWEDKDRGGGEAYARDVDILSEGAFQWRKAMASEDGEYIVI